MSGMQRMGAVALAVAATVMAGCASSQGYDTRASDAWARTANYSYTSHRVARRVDVENNSWNLVTVYVQNGAGAQVRLGDVEAMNRSEFSVDAFSDDGSGGVHLVARPLAGQSFTSEQFLFPAGATAVWTIENHTALSHVRVR